MLEWFGMSLGSLIFLDCIGILFQCILYAGAKSTTPATKMTWRSIAKIVLANFAIFAIIEFLTNCFSTIGSVINPAFFVFQHSA